MDTYLTVTTVRDGPVRTLILCGELDLIQAGGLLQQAALAVDNQTERLVLDMAGVTFLDCAGARALATAASFAPVGCPVIIRSLNPIARRILELTDVDLENLRGFGPGREPQDELLASAASQQKPRPVRG
jgi:anti-anti-sigma factor